MGTVSFTPPTDGSTADAADVVTPLNTIYNEFNGNIDNANIKSAAAIATSKLADDAGITTAKIGTDAVTAAKIDWASTGANGGIWWEELGRTTLNSTNATLSVTVPARNYLHIRCMVIGTATTISPILRFNSDSSTNYSYRSSSNGGADATSTSQTSIPLVVFTGASWHAYDIDIVDYSAVEKVAFIQILTNYTAGAGNVIDRREIVAKWANTSTQITSVSITTAASTFASGSELVVLGHN